MQARLDRDVAHYRLLPAGVRALNDARAAVDTIWSGLEWPLTNARSMA